MTNVVNCMRKILFWKDLSFQSRWYSAMHVRECNETRVSDTAWLAFQGVATLVHVTQDLVKSPNIQVKIDKGDVSVGWCNKMLMIYFMRKMQRFVFKMPINFFVK